MQMYSAKTMKPKSYQREGREVASFEDKEGSLLKELTDQGGD